MTTHTPGETELLRQARFNPLTDSTIAKLFIWPTIILLVVFNVFPLLWSLFLSFSNYSARMPNVWGKNPRMVGVQNFRDIMTSRDFWVLFTTTAKYVVMSVGGEMILGFGLALLLQAKFRGKGIIQTLLVLPMTMSPVIVGIMWKLFLDPNWGLFNYVLGIGKIDWASDPHINLFSIVMVDIWMWTPFVMLLSMAGLSAVPESLYEAAEVDRASWWYKFTRITLPMVWPLLLVALIFRTMEAFKIFDLPMGITGRGTSAPRLLAYKLYNDGFLTWQTSMGASLGYIVLVIIIMITAVFIKYLNRAKR